MEDKDIVAMYWRREEDAISETRLKYGKYCYSIAYQILKNREDAEECENDTYLGAWNSMPPEKPFSLSAFLGRISRNLSLKKWRAKTAIKRGGKVVTLTLDELSECIPDSEGIDEIIELKELAMVIDSFLRALPEEERKIFIRRYWYFDSIIQIAGYFGYGQSKVKMQLLRTRKRLLDCLEKEGVYL